MHMVAQRLGDGFGGEGQAADFLTVLLEQGLAAHLLRKEDVRTISGYYGEVSRWEFAVLGTGRVVTRKAPRAAILAAQNSLPGSGDGMER